MISYNDNASFLRVLTPIRQVITWLNLKGVKIVRIKLDDNKEPVIEVEKITFVMDKTSMYEKNGYSVIEENGCKVISKSVENQPAQ